jgi:hypothetical protein
MSDRVGPDDESASVCRTEGASVTGETKYGGFHDGSNPVVPITFHDEPFGEQVERLSRCKTGLATRKLSSNIKVRWFAVTSQLTQLLLAS